MPYTVPIVILGTDAVLAALPATAVQLAHACMQAGFASVIPASWGDELIAAATLRRLPDFGSGPAIHCSCPIVAHRLLSVSGDLRPVLLPLVPPPVALARYIRARSQPTRARVTFVGGCPGAMDDSIDIRMSPEALLSMLAERNIRLEDQPRVFESFIPADRRRFRSQPGGLPTVEALWSDSASRTVVEVDGEDLVAEVAQHLLAGGNVLIDAATTLGCACTGAVSGMSPKDARAFVASLEPSRATAPVVDENTPIALDLRIPAAPRTPVDVMAIPSTHVPTYSVAARGVAAPAVVELTPPSGVTAIPEVQQSPRAPSPARPITGSTPVVRSGEGKEGRTLPRAYVARRRLTPRNTPIISADATKESSPAVEPEPETVDSREPVFSAEPVTLAEPADPIDQVDVADPVLPVETPASAHHTEEILDATLVAVGEPLQERHDGRADEIEDAIANEADADVGDVAEASSVSSEISNGSEVSSGSEAPNIPSLFDVAEDSESPQSATRAAVTNGADAASTLIGTEPTETADSPTPADAGDVLDISDTPEVVLPPEHPDAAQISEAANEGAEVAAESASLATEVPTADEIPAIPEAVEAVAAEAIPPRPAAVELPPVAEQSRYEDVRPAARLIPTTPPNPRRVVFMILAIIAIAAAVGAAVAILVERRFAAPRITASASNDA